MLQTSSFVWLNKTTIQCLLKEVNQCYISSKILPYQNTVVFKCLVEFAYPYQAQNNIPVFKLLIMFDVQYWKCNNICSAWKIKEKLKVTMVTSAPT